MHIDFAAIATKLHSYQSQLHLNSSCQPPLYQCVDCSQNKVHDQPWNPNTLYIVASPDIFQTMLNEQCPNVIYVHDTMIPIPTSFHGNVIQITDSTATTIYNTVQQLIKMNQKLTIDCEKLYNLLFENAGLQEMINTAYEMLGNPIALCDLSFVLIAAPKQLSSDDIVTEYIDTYNKANDFSQFYNVYRDKGFFEQVAVHQAPMIVKDSDIDDLTYLISHINIGQKPTAFISVLEYNHPFEDYDIELLTVLSKVISLEMQKSGYTDHIKQSQNEYWVYHLLEDHYLPDLMEQSKPFIQEAGYASSFCVMVIAIEKYARQNTLLPFIKKGISTLLGRTITLQYHNDIVVLLPVNSHTMLTKENLQPFLTFLQDNSLVCGLSHTFEQLKELKHYYLQANKSIELAIRLDEGEQRLLFYEDYVLYDLLDIYKCPDQLKSFCHPGLVKLMKYDRTYNTHFTMTLYQYLIHNYNQSKTASALHIQRSTLLYRLKKIEDIMNIALEQAEVLLQLNMSFKILKLIGEF